MRIFNLFLFFIIALAVFVILLQNADVLVDVQIFNHTFFYQKLAIVLLFSFVIGVLFGALYMLYPYLKAKSTNYKLRKEYDSLYDELESISTVTIDELPDDSHKLSGLAGSDDTNLE